ncbi:trypsin-like peptidase domain-containing protein [bacterium]|nr:trypsin-like peptidase domain-containing protein [bacterium]
MKNRLFLVITFIMMLIGWTGCDSTKTSDELYSECSSGVVLVVNQYYHKITLPTGKVWYFSDFDEDGDLEDWTMDQEEILKNRKLITGTGFFISDKGVILTNNHVANPQIAVKDAKNSVRRVFSAMDEILKAAMQELSDQFDELEKSKSDCVQYNPYLEEYYVNEEKLNEIKTEQAQLKEQYEELKQNKEQLKTMDLSDLSVETICDLGIAYNDTYVTKISDLVPCVVVKVSDKENVDLATLQLKNKQTPDNKYIFAVNETQEESFSDKVKNLFSDNDQQELKTGQKLFMIGYNAGFTLSNTQQGIKAQITNGTISQMPDEDKMMYTIPSLPGSSGSPVLNEYGQLVAVNFAGIRETQNFNYGIQLKRVQQFLAQ